MAVDKRVRGKQRTKRQDEADKPTKTEYAVAKFLRFNVPIKEGKLMGMTVQYFIANKAVDALMESKWSANKNKSDPLFTNRASCVDFCDGLLHRGLYHRAGRVERKKDREKKKKKAGQELEEKPKEEKGKKEKKKKTRDDRKDETDDTVKEEEKEELVATEKEDKEEKDQEKKDEKKDEEKKRRKKLKLEMHQQQMFKDGDEIYVWIYDPVHFKTFIIGLLLVLGAIGVCLFPLWPPEVRLGVYYLSLAAASFVGFIIALWVVRLVLFCTIWCVTFGKHHFWFLPNLTEEVSFFDSFKPLYDHEVVLHSDSDNKDTDKTPEEITPSGNVKSQEGKNSEKEKSTESENRGSGGDEADREESVGDSGSDDAGPDNGYEFVDQEDIDEEVETLEPKKTR